MASLSVVAPLCVSCVYVFECLFVVCRHVCVCGPLPLCVCPFDCVAARLLVWLVGLVLLLLLLLLCVFRCVLVRVCVSVLIVCVILCVYV